MENLPKIVVALNLDEMDVPNLCAAAKGVKTTGDPDVTTPPVTDDKLKEDADAVMVVHEQRYTNQSESLTRLENELASKLKRAYGRVGRYVQDISNEVAVTNGNYDAGVAVVLRCGFTLKKKGQLPPRDFEVVKSAPGWAHLRQKAVAKQAGYIWRGGKTTEIGKVPEQMEPPIFTLECEVVFTNLNRGDIIGVQTTSVLPASRTSQTSTEITGITKNASLGTATKAKKASVPFGIDSLYWSDFIYFVCQ